MGNSLCSHCRGLNADVCGKCFREVSEKLASLLAAAQYAISPLEVIARTGRVSQGGEQTGNLVDVEWARDKIRAAIAKCEGN